MTGVQTCALPISKERGEEASHIREKVAHCRGFCDAIGLTWPQEQAQLSAIRAQQEAAKSEPSAEHDFEGGFGGQEDLEDRYATTSGEH